MSTNQFVALAFGPAVRFVRQRATKQFDRHRRCGCFFGEVNYLEHTRALRLIYALHWSWAAASYELHDFGDVSHFSASPSSIQLAHDIPKLAF